MHYYFNQTSFKIDTGYLSKISYTIKVFVDLSLTIISAQLFLQKCIYTVIALQF